MPIGHDPVVLIAPTRTGAPIAPSKSRLWQRSPFRRRRPDGFA